MDVDTSVLTTPPATPKPKSEYKGREIRLLLEREVRF
jgi:hypothetical protein